MGDVPVRFPKVARARLGLLLSASSLATGVGFLANWKWSLVVVGVMGAMYFLFLYDVD